MRTRTLGKSGVAISEIGFGCGNVGGLLIRGASAEQLRAIERAVQLGVTYFDTAASYGDGLSERNLGAALHALHPDVLVGTKLGLTAEDLENGAKRARALFNESLQRLGRTSVDILYYHGRIRETHVAGDRALTVSHMLGPVHDLFEDLRRDGRIRFLGFTGLGETSAVIRTIDSGAFDVLHCYFSAVNPSAGYSVPAGFAPQNMNLMIDHATAAGMGVLAIRILAAGALADSRERHPLAGGTGGTLITGTDYAADVARGERLKSIASELGVSLAELAIRFALSRAGIATALVGVSSVEQIEFAARAAEAGPLPHATVERIVATATR
ncbi:MAG TPA: aldo/keto reductase [Chloroflexota bacterium]|nr:aldo/keto reductase [Chloroflexota bacterium]